MLQVQALLPPLTRCPISISIRPSAAGAGRQHPCVPASCTNNNLLGIEYSIVHTTGIILPVPTRSASQPLSQGIVSEPSTAFVPSRLQVLAHRHSRQPGSLQQSTRSPAPPRPSGSRIVGLPPKLRQVLCTVRDALTPTVVLAFGGSVLADSLHQCIFPMRDFLLCTIFPPCFPRAYFCRLRCPSPHDS